MHQGQNPLCSYSGLYDQSNQTKNFKKPTVIDWAYFVESICHKKTFYVLFLQHSMKTSSGKSNHVSNQTSLQDYCWSIQKAAFMS